MDIRVLADLKRTARFALSRLLFLFATEKLEDRERGS